MTPMARLFLMLCEAMSNEMDDKRRTNEIKLTAEVSCSG